MKWTLVDSAETREMAVNVLFKNHFKAVESFRTEHPQTYDQMVYAHGGHGAARSYMLEVWASEIRQGRRASWLPLPHDAFVHHVQSESPTSFAPLFTKMTWTWLTSPSLDFVIGDDPVCRFGTAEGRWEYGITHADIEVTIPLARNTCLLLTNNGTETEDLIEVSDEQVLTFNRRQIASSLQFVYGPSQVALRPDDEDAQYGF